MTLKGSHHQCGGAIVAPDLIMTAAHGLSLFDSIRQHKGSTMGRGNELAFTDVVVHPNFDVKSFHSDLMVIKLEKPIEGANVIEINPSPSIPLPSQSLVVVGWGVTDAEERRGRTLPGALHFADVPYIPNRRCERTQVNGKQLYQGRIEPSMLCAGGLGRDACRGDSGSPLVITWNKKEILAGIVSWGKGCAMYPGVYTRISSYYLWARQQICGLSVAPPSYLACTSDERPSSLSVPSSSPSVYSSPSPSSTTALASMSPTGVRPGWNESGHMKDRSEVHQTGFDKRKSSDAKSCRMEDLWFSTVLALGSYLIIL